ncbi:unnamed protein product [Caenorhabditis auriculariae]|uniref:Uncharacterized protein n=1 Tax=Caenorhabditis auriculariae TaxID=2777116 RepID=A0A8S1H258_9PELO|nr:unnamed protein product [Caenorhabditis auriculariae]
MDCWKGSERTISNLTLLFLSITSVVITTAGTVSVEVWQLLATVAAIVAPSHLLHTESKFYRLCQASNPTSTNHQKLTRRASMSSVASKHALLIALGGVSIAALFVWYVHAKREEEKRKQRDTVLKAAEPKKETKQKSVEKPQKPAEPKVEAKVEEELAPEDKLVEELNQELANAPRVVEKPREPSISLPEQIEETDVKVKVISHEEAEILRNIRDDEEPSNELEESSNDAVPRASEFPPLPITEESLEAKEEAEKIGEECERALAGGDFPPSTYSEVVQTSPEEVAEKKAEEARREEAEKIEIAEKEFPPLPDLEEENLKEKEVENQKSSTSSADLTTDSAQEPEITAEEILELTHLDEPLSLDVMQQSPAAFSWSEEMERTYSQEQSFNMTIESSDADPFVDSPRSPHFEKQRSQHRKNRNRRNRNSTSKSDRGSVQPATQNIAQKGSKQEKKQQSKHVETQKKVEPTPLPEELHQVHENLGYEKSESPGVASQHSEVSFL